MGPIHVSHGKHEWLWLTNPRGPGPSLAREPSVLREAAGSRSYFPKSHQAGSGFGLTINTASCNEQTWEVPPETGQSLLDQSCR